MAAIAIIVGGISIVVLYNTAYEVKRQDLIQMAQSQARLIEAIARFDQKYSAKDHPLGAAAATISQVNDAISAYKGFGETGEFVLGNRKADKIIFLLSFRHPTPNKQGRPTEEGARYVPYNSSLAEPMRRALSGQSGTVVGSDYRGEEVLAAHEPIKELGLGIVAKIDLAEIRAPYLKAALIVIGFGLLIIFFGSLLFFRISSLIATQIIKGEETLAATTSELEFQKLALDEHAIVSITDVDGNITYVNDRFCAISGHTRDELIGQNHRILKSGEHDQAFYQDLWQTITSGKTWEGEIKNQKKNGDYYWVRATIVPFLDEQGTPFQYVAIRTDETERLETVTKLAESQIMISAVLENSPSAISVKGLDGLYLIVNKVWNDWFNPTHKEAVGKAVGDFFEPAHVSGIDAQDTEVLESGNAVSTETQTPHSDGTIRTSILQKFPVRDANNKIFGIGSMNTDISDRVRAEKEVTQFRTTLDHTQDCIFMFWPDPLRFFYVNQGGMTQVGYTQDELYKMAPFQIKPEFTEAEFRNMIQGLMEGPEHATTFETIHQHKNGNQVPVEIFLQYIFPLNENPRFVAIVRDITERKEVDRMKSEFVSTVSHELRTPLTSIKGALGMVKSGALGDISESALDMVDVAHKNSDRLIQLVNDILDMEKLQSGNMELDLENLDLTALVREAVETNQGYAQEQNSKFVFGDLASGVTLQADAGRLTQVIANLLSNAAKFSPDGGIVKISITHDEREATVSVTDSGPGIDEEMTDLIFGRFTQVDSSDTREKGGTGLGLNISKSIVELHGGTIGFKSEVGTGSTFFFTLPVTPAGRLQT